MKLIGSFNKCPACGKKLPLIGFKQKFIWRGFLKKSDTICPYCNLPSRAKIHLKSAIFYLSLTVLLIIFMLKVLSGIQTQSLKMIFVALLVVVGIRASYRMVAIENYASKKVISFKNLLLKKLPIGIFVSFIAFWFTANLAMFLFLKYKVGVFEIESINNVPEKIRIEKQVVDGETLHLMGYKLKFPFYTADIKEIKPSFTNNRELHNFKIKIANNNENGYIVFSTSSNNLNNNGDTKKNVFKKAVKSNFEMLRAIQYTRLKDFSLWNVRHNLKLTVMLILKATMPHHTKIYEVETQHIDGFLEESERNRSIMTFTFPCGDKLNTISFIDVSRNIKSNIKNIISTIQPVDNVVDSYDEIKTLYEGKKESLYPKELILLSIITLKGPKIDYLKELLNIMKMKSYDSSITESLEKQIKYFETQSSENLDVSTTNLNSSNIAEHLKPHPDYPLIGFWKDNCWEPYGWVIDKAYDGLYSVFFCGPGGCEEPGRYTPNTTIVDDPGYRVINKDTIEIKGSDGYSRYKRCS